MTQLQNRTLRWGPFDGREVQSVEFPGLIWLSRSFIDFTACGNMVPFTTKPSDAARHCYRWDYDRQEFVFAPVSVRMKEARQ